MTATLTDNEESKLFWDIQQGLGQVFYALSSPWMVEARKHLKVELLAHSILAPLPDRKERWLALSALTMQIKELRAERGSVPRMTSPDEFDTELHMLYGRRELLVDEAAGEIASLVTGRTTSKHLTLSS